MKKNAYDDYKYRSLSGEKVRWQGFWITSHRFYHLPSCRKYGHDRKPEFNSEIQNIHTLFRKNFTLCRSDIVQAKLFITGDDLYKLYLNSSFIGEGPAQSYPFAYNYNCYDVTDLVHEGKNTVAVHIYYQGLFNIYLVSADNLCGMIAQLEIEYADGTKETVISDRSWKYTECSAYSSRYIYGYQTQFSEDIDLNAYPQGWTEREFSDSNWNKAIVSANPFPVDYSLVPQLTPTVKHEKIYPAKIKKLECGYLFDFGKEVVGNLAVTLKGSKKETVEIRFGEELNDDGRVRYEIRANCVYSDVITLSGGEDFVDYYDYKGYRYAEILDPPKDFDPKNVYTFSRNYPFDDNAASFECSNDSMNRIWEICKHGVKIGTQDTYYDCPTREKGGFVGDALITGLSHLILTGDTKIYKKFITDCANTARWCPAIAAHLPTYDINICADYSSLVPLFLEEYYNYTADKDFLEEMLPVAEGIWEYYSQFLNDDHLLESIKHMDKVPKEMQAILIDWPQNLRDGYDMEKAAVGISTTVNMFFYGFLKTLAKLYLIVGNVKRASELEEKHQAMGKSIINRTYDYGKGIFRDTADSDHCALHANALQLFFGLEPPKGYKPIVDFIMKKRLNCGVYFAYFVIKGLYTVGEHEAAYDLLTGRDGHSWYNMIKSGATTSMEAWGPEQKWNTSWCHPWSSSPIYFYTAEIMGIKGAAPGMKKIKITPKINESLNYATIKIPVPKGEITASFKRTENGCVYTVNAPSDIEIEFEGNDINFEFNYTDYI